MREWTRMPFEWRIFAYSLLFATHSVNFLLHSECIPKIRADSCVRPECFWHVKNCRSIQSKWQTSKGTRTAFERHSDSIRNIPTAFERYATSVSVGKSGQFFEWFGMHLECMASALFPYQTNSVKITGGPRTIRRGQLHQRYMHTYWTTSRRGIKIIHVYCWL